jgi:hypothetical protein
MPSDAEEVRDRFFAERDYIQRYIDFVLNAADIPDHVIGEINERLQYHGLASLPARTDDRLEHPFPSVPSSAWGRTCPKLRFAALTRV